MSSARITFEHYPRQPHRGAGRAIQPGQKIHASVAFRDRGYTPKAIFTGHRSRPPQWQNLIGDGPSGKYLKNRAWKKYLEMDLFDLRDTPKLISDLESVNIEDDDALRILHQLNFMAIPSECNSLCYVSLLTWFDFQRKVGRPSQKLLEYLISSNAISRNAKACLWRQRACLPNLLCKVTAI